MTAADVLAVTALAVAAASLLALVATVVATRRGRRADRDALAQVALELAALREERAVAPAVEPQPGLDGARTAGGTDDDASAPYLITGVGDDPAHLPTAAPPGRIEGRLFADLVLRESVVKGAALAHGLRRAAAPEVRDRVRIEVRRELRRARKQRRVDLREARRHLHAQQRADLPAGEDAA